MIPKFEIVQEFKVQENNIIRHIEKIDVSKYTRIELIDSRTVSSNPDFKYAIILPLFGGYTYLYPDEISNHKYYLNEKEIKLPTDSIERLYVEMYKLLHMEYIKALVDEL